MPLLVRNVALRWDEPEDLLGPRAARILGLPPKAIRAYGIIRRAIDARRGRAIERIYHLEVAVDGDEERILGRLQPNRVARLVRPAEPDLEPGHQPLDHPPVIIGSGPAGLFAALLLAERGYRPILLERGQDATARHRAMNLFYTTGQFDPENNLLFGIGGAGCYSDGKLYSRTHDPRNSWVLQQLVRFGAHPDIAIDAKPHVGSDRLPGICRKIVKHILECGGEVHFGAHMTDFEFADAAPTGDAASQPLRMTAVVTADGRRFPASQCILAIGHSARDTYRLLRARGVALAAKPFQMGVRIEHPQDMINRNQFGPAADSLPPADYHLVATNAALGAGPCKDDLFSFCMCPGGTILPSNESPGEICTNGASRARRNSPFANSGLVVTILPEAFDNDPLAGIEYQRRWERLAYQASNSYAVPAQRVTDFLAGRRTTGRIECSYPLGTASADMRGLLPEMIVTALQRGLPMLDRMVPGYASKAGVLTAPETRASSPLRIVRNPEDRQSATVAGLYPVGEGAGYAGGIVSSATDGLKSAELILKQFAPLT